MPRPTIEQLREVEEGLSQRNLRPGADLVQRHCDTCGTVTPHSVWRDGKLQCLACGEEREHEVS